MNAISRRDVLRASSLALAVPFTGIVQAMPAVSQSIVQQKQRYLSADLVQYIANGHISITAKVKAGNALTLKQRRAISGQWRLLSTHMRDISIDTQLQALLPTLITSGKLTNVDQSTYYPALYAAYNYLQQYGVSLTRDEFLASIGPLPQGDITDFVKSSIGEGLSTQCDKIANSFDSIASSDDNFKPMSYIPHPTSFSAPKLLHVCGHVPTKKEKYDACYNRETAIAAIIVDGGFAICLLVPGCAEALVGLSSAGLLATAANGVLGVAAITGWLVGKYCGAAPELADNFSPATAINA